MSLIKLSFLHGKKLFSKTPIIAAIAILDMEIVLFLIVIDITAPPRPITSILLIINKIKDFVNSTFQSNNTLNPLEAIKPYKIIEIPPITHDGIAAINSINTLQKDKIIAIIAANPVT